AEARGVVEVPGGGDGLAVGAEGEVADRPGAGGDEVAARLAGGGVEEAQGVPLLAGGGHQGAVGADLDGPGIIPGAGERRQRADLAEGPAADALLEGGEEGTAVGREGDPEHLLAVGEIVVAGVVAGRRPQAQRAALGARPGGGQPSPWTAGERLHAGAGAVDGAEVLAGLDVPTAYLPGGAAAVG